MGSARYDWPFYTELADGDRLRSVVYAADGSGGAAPVRRRPSSCGGEAGPTLSTLLRRDGTYFYYVLLQAFTGVDRCLLHCTAEDNHCPGSKDQSTALSFRWVRMQEKTRKSL